MTAISVLLYHWNILGSMHFKSWWSDRSHATLRYKRYKIAPVNQIVYRIEYLTPLCFAFQDPQLPVGIISWAGTFSSPNAQEIIVHQIGGAQHSQKSNQNFIAIVSYSNVSQMNVLVFFFFFFFFFLTKELKVGIRPSLESELSYLWIWCDHLVWSAQIIVVPCLLCMSTQEKY